MAGVSEMLLGLRYGTGISPLRFADGINRSSELPTAGPSDGREAGHFTKRKHCVVFGVRAERELGLVNNLIEAGRHDDLGNPCIRNSLHER